MFLNRLIFQEFSLKNKTMFKILFLSLVLSSCGLIERFKTPEQPTDSSSGAATEEVATSSSSSADATDDLFSKTMEETSTTQTDSPSNVSHNDSDLKSLEDEFSASGLGETMKEAPIALTPDRSQEAPVIVEESLPSINTPQEEVGYSVAGQVKTYKVKKGETLMQIAFKLYGDISKWKDLKSMNAGIGSNTALRANTELKYRAPATPFVWNPAGSPYLIKNGETLGTISNSVYSTPKKWKAIWENNKPLIKNPNVIYAGFTLYYTNGGMANYVQPKSAQPKQEVVEEVIVDKMRVPAAETLAPAAPSAPAAPATQSTVQFTEEENQQVDEAIQSLSAPKRGEKEEKEIDLINNISVPHEAEEMAPDIDEEIQTL